jgi:hypothetical protein
MWLERGQVAAHGAVLALIGLIRDAGNIFEGSFGLTATPPDLVWSHKASENAALALCYLARSRDLRVKIVEGGGLPVLLRLLLVSRLCRFSRFCATGAL